MPNNRAVMGTGRDAPLASDRFAVITLALRTVRLQKAAMNGHYIGERMEDC